MVYSSLASSLNKFAIGLRPHRRAYFFRLAVSLGGYPACHRINDELVESQVNGGSRLTRDFS